MPSKQKKSDKGSSLVDLSPEEIARLPKPREGFDAHVEPLLALYEKNLGELRIKGLNVNELRAKFGTFQSLQAIEAAAAKHLEMVQETRLLNSSNVWSGLLEIYAKAQAVGRTDTGIKRGIADFEQFMKLGPRKKKPAASP